MKTPSCVCGVSIFFLFLFFSTHAWAGHDTARPAKKGILLVAFGTTVPEAKTALDQIESQVATRFPGLPIYWAYSSRQVRSTLADSGTHYDSVATALARMADEGFTHVAVQSLHTIPGAEFQGLRETVTAMTGLPKGIKHIELGQPLLSSHEDLVACAQAIMDTLPEKRGPKDAVLLMGHGTHHPANVYYPGLQYYLWQLDPLVFIATVESAPFVDDVRRTLQSRKVQTVYLMPFMAVAGDHARNDMAGPEEDSWTSILTSDGLTCIPVLRGTGEREAFVRLWLDHLHIALERLAQ
ncbi:sirohydrochlorin cobaltochelatase [Desulfovibrionales bacterium]